ncbi:catalase-like [Brevipalpus obovatus]|uniref:catalase-like n=1 Tax=Brevipalpus obovatus TaxID=246614 RepID=UPI003D9DB552
MKFITIFVIFFTIISINLAKLKVRISRDSDDISYIPTGNGKPVTANNGAKIANTFNILSAGKHGPVLLADNIFLEKMSHFSRERTPERRNAPIGNGAFGYFVCTNPDLPKLTSATIFSYVGKKTDLVVRFGVESGRIGGPEVGRGVNTMGIKFYSDHGNYDLLSLNVPVFSNRDPSRFLDFVHSRSPDPETNAFNVDHAYDYPSLMPETMGILMNLYSDSSAIEGWRGMDFYPLNTFKFVNSQEKFVYVRFAIDALQKQKVLSEDERMWIAGIEPNSKSKDLREAIDSGNYPKWLLQAQVMSEKEFKQQTVNPLDPTRRWNVTRFPWFPMGKIVLNKNPTNWFSQVEQLAFNPGNIIPGIQLTLDKVLQGRIFAYRDTQNHRLGGNQFKLPINRPKVSLNQPYIRDGYCTDFDNGGSGPSFVPNSIDPVKEFEYHDFSDETITNEDIKRFHTEYEDNYEEPRNLWNSFDSGHQRRIAKRFASELVNVKTPIKNRFLDQIERIDKGFRAKLEGEIRNLSNDKSPKPPPVDSKPKISSRFESDISPRFESDISPRYESDRSLPSPYSSLLTDFRSNVLKSFGRNGVIRG